jgi:uncharacterized protein (DUF305 family)
MLQTIGILDYKKEMMGDPCKEYVTDAEFLKHMIPHHQVAIDMSKKVLLSTNNPTIIYLARNILYKQSDEILLMENILLSGIPNMASPDKDTYIERTNQFSFYYPKESRANKSVCTSHHFDPSLIHINHKLTDNEYLEHMIPHHDIAISMAERVTKNSKNPTMVSFAYDVIGNQRYEIWLMKQLFTSLQIHSPILEPFDGKLNNRFPLILIFSAFFILFIICQL